MESDTSIKSEDLATLKQVRKWRSNKFIITFLGKMIIPCTTAVFASEKTATTRIVELLDRTWDPSEDKRKKGRDKTRAKVNNLIEMGIISIVDMNIKLTDKLPFRMDLLIKENIITEEQSIRFSQMIDSQDEEIQNLAIIQLQELYSQYKNKK